MTREVTILTSDPIVAPIFQMSAMLSGIHEMTQWIREVRPGCVPDDSIAAARAPFAGETSETYLLGLLPHNIRDSDGGRTLSDNELLPEIAGRKCYDSWGAKAGRKSNKDYIAHTQSFDIPHASILYHPHMTFFFAGISRRVSHELMRNYIGHAKDEEGSPSQESTRYCEHAGRYIAPPWILGDADEIGAFRADMQVNYDAYLAYIARQMSHLEDTPIGVVSQAEKTERRKRIYESASARLAHTCETSWIWTSNPIALAKMIKERDHNAADLEFQRFARKLKRVCMQHWPNCFPQPWMSEGL